MNRASKLFVLAGVLVLCGLSALIQRHFDQKLYTTAPHHLYEVVRRQIDAFRADDYASAYRQVSSSFQERFNIESFSDLARTEYPGISRAERVEFGAIRFEGRHAIIPVYFFLQDGDVVPCVYSLVNEHEGWKIDGARVLKRWPAGRRLGGMRS
ncbi:MAG TPA: DUF4864 domain-containing protein [Chthoniobacteraceae bacterium]|jgi:hypothetical protein|nr:DUF4864 domain-containing protein [Chthoniobacteraceae bacterium]